MRGYFRTDRPGVLQPAGRMVRHGDIVTTTDGFVAIRGARQALRQDRRRDGVAGRGRGLRRGRLADASHAPVSLPDARKGEVIVLVSDWADAKPDALLAYAQAHGIPEIAVPKKVVTVEALPVLGTGKLDFVAIGEIAARE